MAQRDEVVTFTYKIVGDDQLAATAVTMAKTGTAAEGASEEVVKLSDSLKTAASSATLIEQALGEKAALSDLTAQLKAAQQGLDKLRSEFDETDTSSKKVTKAFSDAQKAVASLTQQQTAASVALQKTEGALQKAGVDTTNLAASYAKVNAQGNAAATSLAAIGAASAKAAAGTKDAATSTKSLGDESQKTGGLLDELKDHMLHIISAATALELAFKGIEFGKESVAGAADVEATLSRIKVTAEGAADEFGKLGDAIEESARAANVSNAQSAQAALALAQQGEKANEIFQTLTPTLLLAKDANLEVAESAKAVDDILDAFQLNASQAGDAVDKLVVASKGSSDALKALSGAMAQLAPDAKQLGLNFDQLVGLLGFLDQNGLSAEKSVRGLRSVFQELQDPASKFSLALAAIGDNTADFGRAIAAIRDGGKQGQDALLSLSGTGRTLVAFLAQQAPDAVDKFTASLANATGQASKVSKAIDDNLTGSFKDFENSIDRLGEKLAAPVLKPLADEFTKLAGQINAFTDSDDFAKLAEQIGKFASDAAKAFDGIVSGIDWDSFVANAKTAIGDASSSLKTLADNASTVAGAINKIGAAIGALKNFGDVGIKALEVAFGATTTAIVGTVDAAAKGVDKLRGSTSQLGTALDQATDHAIAFTKGGVAGIGDATDKASADIAELGGAARASFADVEHAAASTAPLVNDIADSTKEAADAAAKFGEVGPGVFENTAAAANASAKAVSDQNQAIIDAQAAVDKTRKAFDDLVRSGNGSAEAMLQAKKAFEDAQASLDKLTGATQKAADAQGNLDRAFATLGITTQDKLDQAAKAAATALDTINKAFLAGNATLADVQRAYDAYAKTVRAAVSDSTDAVKSEAEAQLATKAALLSVTDAAKKAGDTAEDAGNRTSKAFAGASDSAEKAAHSIGDASSETSKWAQKIDDFNNDTQAWADSLAAVATKAASADQGVTLLTNDQLRALRQIRDEWLSGALSAEQYAQRVKAALTGVDEQLQQQTEELQAFQDRLLDLEGQLASARGDPITEENIRHQKAMQDLKDEQDLTTTQKAQLERLEEQLHEANLKRIKAENDARQAGNDQQANQQTNKNAGGTGNDAAGGGAGVGPSVPTAPPPPNVIVNAVLLSGDPRAADDFARFIQKRITNIDNNSR